ncbi:MAG: hypothetical protein A2Y89_06375 [Chloroflexi bacterium RBG_13_51_18]|nr:MAG: hypothetical protein A2Y89_06375 [Chloroflexi bacterium RBG_13_51_18]
MKDIKYQCPVCHTKLNSSRRPFISPRAVSLHIAGKIKTSDNDHKYWAWEQCGQEKINAAITESKATNGINVIGDLLIIPVIQWHDEHGKSNIGFTK